MATTNQRARFPRISAGFRHFIRLKIAAVSLEYKVSNRDASIMIETALEDPTVVDRIKLSFEEQADTLYTCGGQA